MSTSLGVIDVRRVVRADSSDTRGDFEATWPADLAADLHLKTMNGHLFTDFDATALASAPRTVERRNGRVRYRSNDGATVRVGRGGPQLQLQSLNGDVRVLRGAR